ncbi:MAG: polyprenyl synthetase family protein [Bacteroidales bacterium]|jgi:geranylgeranyl diphosphate synthase type II
MFAKAYELLIKTDEIYYNKILKVFNQTSIEVCEGQQFDMNFETQEDITIPEYIKMIRLKTGVLIAACFNVGSIIAFASDEDAQNIYSFGENLGIAFQLQDDLLDVYAEQNKFGKKIGSDILTNKKTFLLIKALELAKDKTSEKLKSILKSNNFIPEEKIKEVTAIYNFLNIKELTIKMIDNYYEKSLRYLELLSINNGKKKVLKDFAGSIMKRDF